MWLDMKNQGIRIDDELFEWLDSQVKSKRFASISHGVRYCVQETMRRERGK